MKSKPKCQNQFVFNHLIKEIFSDPSNPTTNTPHNFPQGTNALSFASKLASEQLPKRVLTIVFNIIENISQIEYVIALGKSVSPTDIIYAFRVANGRFCVQNFVSIT